MELERRSFDEPHLLDDAPANETRCIGLRAVREFHLIGASPASVTEQPGNDVADRRIDAEIAGHHPARPPHHVLADWAPEDEPPLAGLVKGAGGEGNRGRPPRLRQEHQQNTVQVAGLVSEAVRQASPAISLPYRV